MYEPIENVDLQKKTRSNLCNLLCTLIMGIVFLVYANNVETDIPCWSDGNVASPIPLSDDYADVAKAFQVTLQGCGIAGFLSFVLLGLVLFHLRRGDFGKVALYSMCNLCLSLASMGFVIALFVYRLRPSGVLCSEAPYLVERGKFIYVFFWIFVSSIGLSCLIICAALMLARR